MADPQRNTLIVPSAALRSVTSAVDQEAPRIRILLVIHTMTCEIAGYLEQQPVELHIRQCSHLESDEISSIRPDSMLIDTESDGLRLCGAIRQVSAVPLILLTASYSDMVPALDTGADDVVLKPFSQRELLARLRSHARRFRGESGPPRHVVDLGWLRVDRRSQTVRVDGVPVDLTTLQLEMLFVLAEGEGQTFSRAELALQTSGSGGLTRSIDVLIARMRMRLPLRRKSAIEAIRNVGYRLRFRGSELEE